MFRPLSSTSRAAARTAVLASLVGLAACSSSDDGVRVLPADDGVTDGVAALATTTRASEMMAAAKGDIVDTAVAAGTFTTLVAALQATGLDATLGDDDETFTVFAPTDEAFAALGQDTIDALLGDTGTLSDILLYHVVPGVALDAASAFDLAGSRVTTANGDTLQVSVDGMRLFVNESEVTVTDVAATNGIIHVIDAVLTPSGDAPTDDGDDGGTDETPTSNLVETAIGAGSFTTLVAALQATGLDATLADGEATFTVFAPTDEAFAALGQDTIDALLADPDTLRDILLYHVVAGQALDAAAAFALAGSTVTTANGDDVALTLERGALRINMSDVITPDVFASNGVIHVIDEVLMPPADVSEGSVLVDIVQTAREAGGFTTLIAALEATGLDGLLADPSFTFTVLAPTDEAFAKLGDETINALLADPTALAEILSYHVIQGVELDATDVIAAAGSDVATVNGATVAVSLQGDRLFVNASEVIATDVRASNGIVHAIDTVLIPPAGTDGADPDVPATGTLLDVARDAGEFTILVAALEATGLDAALGHPDDLYTVFAPTDAAFQALGQDTIDALLADPATLRDILLFHILPGTVLDATSVVSLIGTSVEAGNGERFTFREEDGELFVANGRIVTTDVRGANGVIHVVDAVLLPSSSR